MNRPALPTRPLLALVTLLLPACDFTPPRVQGGDVGDASVNPAGESCADTIDLGSLSEEETRTVFGDTSTAGDDMRADQLGCPGGDPGTGNHGDLFYRVRFRNDPRVRVTLDPDGWSPALVILKGTCSAAANGGEVIFCGSNNTGEPIVTPDFQRERDVSYFIWVDGSASGSGSEGSFSLRIERRD